MQSIFVSYRRDDCAPQAKLVAEALKKVIDDESLFFDTDTIEIGTKWPDRIRGALKKSKFVIALIGPNWLKAGMNEWGQRRIDNENDWVRIEISKSLLDSEKTVIPVLIDGAKMPPANTLPECIRGITQRQSVEIRRNYWDHDLQLLTKIFNVNVQSVSPDRGPVMGQYWESLAPNLQDAFVLAANAAKREGKDIISTRIFFAALHRLNPGRLPDLFLEIPEESLPEPTPSDVRMDELALKNINMFSGCIKTSIDQLTSHSKAGKITTEDMFVDIARNGTGESVRKLRKHGVDVARINEIVNQLGWSVINRE